MRLNLHNVGFVIASERVSSYSPAMDRKRSGLSRLYVWTRIVALHAMSLLCFFALTSILGCQKSAESVGQNVRESMQQTFDNNPDFSKYHFYVEKVVAVKNGENTYEGMATVRYGSGEHEVSVRITSDGDNVLWKCDPGTFLFALQ